MSAKLRVISPRILRVKVALVCATPLLAIAAERAMLRVSPLEEISLLTWFFIVLFALIGWAVADVDRIAELWNVGDGTKYQQVLARLKLLKSMLGSLAAGVFTYFLGKVAPGPLVSMMGLKFESGHPPELHEFVLLILVAGAGWLGSRWFERAFGAR
jgi:hypothetical protein